MEKVKLSAPWITFTRELTELFKQDKDVKVSWDKENSNVVIQVENYEKAKALEKIIPKEKIFGNLGVGIKVLYKDKTQDCNVEDLYKLAFENNPALKCVYTVRAEAFPITFVVFERKVVQFWNDDMSDPHGITSTLYENIARDTFNEKNGVIYTTDSDGNIVNKHQPTNKEIEEWEKYNGKGSYSNGSALNDTLNESNLQKPIKVKDEKTFKSIFKSK